MHIMGTKSKNPDQLFLANQVTGQVCGMKLYLLLYNACKQGEQVTWQRLLQQCKFSLNFEGDKIIYCSTKV